MEPGRILLLYPGEALPWLRRQLRLNQRAFAAWLGVGPADVARWERRDKNIPRVYYLRLLPLLERHLATSEGAAFLQALGDGEEGTTA
jgi:DNA-binding transcriptional regulator YiaG